MTQNAKTQKTPICVVEQNCKNIPDFTTRIPTINDGMSKRNTRGNTRGYRLLHTQHVYLSQNWDSDGHFEVLKESKS